MTAIAEILLVEDNPDELELTLSALAESNVGGPVHVARDGAEALDFLFADGSGGATLGMILLDLKLPRVHGIEVLRQVKSSPRTRHIPIVVLTSSQEESDLADSYELGANSYIVKPVDIDEFIDAISAIGSYWLSLNERPGR